MTQTAKTKWENIKLKMIQLFGGLIMEKDEGDGIYRVSLGRVAFWLLFIPAIIIWIKGGGKLINGTEIRDIPDNYMKILVIVLGYNLGSKVANTIKCVMGGGNNIGMNFPMDINTPPINTQPINPNLPPNGAGQDENLRGNPNQ